MAMIEPKTLHDNSIEFYTEYDTATVSFHKKKYINRILQLKEKYPDKVEIVAENNDGTLCARIPYSWVKIYAPPTISDEQREQARKRLQDFRQTKESP